MSYARFGSDSDVYVYDSGFLVCCGCVIQDTSHFKTARLMLEHLNQHTKLGHRVPDYTIEEIKEDYPDLDLDLTHDE